MVRNIEIPALNEEYEKYRENDYKGNERDAFYYLNQFFGGKLFQAGTLLNFDVRGYGDPDIDWKSVAADLYNIANQYYRFVNERLPQEKMHNLLKNNKNDTGGLQESDC